MLSAGNAAWVGWKVYRSAEKKLQQADNRGLSNKAMAVIGYITDWFPVPFLYWQVCGMQRP